MSKLKVWAGVIAFVAVIGSCSSMGDDTAPAPQSQVTPQTAPAVLEPASLEPVETKFVGEEVTVTRVIDGDTFEISTGETIRVLGIDSCESKTYGGKEATSMAENNLTNPGNLPITITTEPGVDKDRYGRLLRYVQMDGGEYDFGQSMVEYDNTGVYAGDNDASDDYVQMLYAADLKYANNPPSGRECGDPYAEFRDDSSSGGNVEFGDKDYNMPDGALTGGYCARKWWC